VLASSEALDELGLMPDVLKRLASLDVGSHDGASHDGAAHDDASAPAG